MEYPPTFQQQPSRDPQFEDQIVNKIKSAGTFDQWRRECLADVDTKPAYQNLTFRVDNAVAAFLSRQRWRPDMAKNQVRENLRRHILELGIIEKGVDRIVEQVVQPKVLPVFHPVVEDAIYSSLGIERPKKEVKATNLNESTSPTKKPFKPMPVSMSSREREEGATPPPGEEEFGLEAITPSSGSRSGSRARKDGGGMADDMSEASMEDNRPPEPLERICSPVSQSSSSHPPGEDRAVSALSVISSGDDLPSSAASPAPSATAEEGDGLPAAAEPAEEPQGSPIGSSNRDSEEEDEEDDFSSPEFEKLDLNAPTSRPVTPVPGEEDQGDKEKPAESAQQQDDHCDFRPKAENQDPDRKPDDQDPSSSKPAGPSSEPSSTLPPATSSESAANKSTSENKGAERPKSSTSSSRDKDRDRSRSSHHKSDKSRKDRDKDRERDREKEKRRDKEHTDRDRDRKSSSSSKHHRSDRHKSSKDQDGDRKKSSSSHHKSSDRDREREKDHRRRDKSESDRHRSSGSSKKKHRSPSPPPHPKAYLWKRPEQPPKALWDYLARFPAKVFQDDNYFGHLSDVSVSSVSSYSDSDAESTILLRLSDVEVDSELEEVLISTGARIAYHEPAPAAVVEEMVLTEWDPPVTAGPTGQQAAAAAAEEPSSNKRVRKVNMRYSDSYVGSEFSKIITQHSSDQQRSPPVLSCSSKKGGQPEDLQPDESNHGMSDSTSPPELEPIDQDSREADNQDDDEEDYPAPEAKRHKAEQLPSSPESVESDQSPPSLPPPLIPVDQYPPAAASSQMDDPQLNSSANRRRSAAQKQPQQRYDDTDLYKPRPVITPSSRRTRRPEDS